MPSWMERLVVARAMPRLNADATRSGGMRLVNDGRCISVAATAAAAADLLLLLLLLRRAE